MSRHTQNAAHVKLLRSRLTRIDFVSDLSDIHLRCGPDHVYANSSGGTLHTTHGRQSDSQQQIMSVYT